MIVTRDRALLIATDIDGTLLDHDAQLPFRADTWRRAIHALGARAAGCRVAFASSRTLDELMVLQRALGVQGPCIAEDGAVLARAADGASDRDPALAPHDELRAYGRRTMCIWTRAQHAAAYAWPFRSWTPCNGPMRHSSIANRCQHWGFALPARSDARCTRDITRCCSILRECPGTKGRRFVPSPQTAGCSCDVADGGLHSLTSPS